MNARMINAEVMKLTRRRGLMAWVLLLAAGGVAVMFSVLAIRHASDPSRYGAAGGTSNFDNSMFLLSMLGSSAAILLGAHAGAGDLTAGVFRDLVVTGRSRSALFRVRWIGALIVFAPAILLGLAVATLASVTFAGGLAAPSASHVLASGGWVLLTTLTILVVAVGLSSLIGSRPTAITALLAWQVIVTPLLLQIGFLGHARNALLGAATHHFAPAGVLDGRSYAVAGASGAIVTIAAWVGIALRAGRWRTETIDA